MLELAKESCGLEDLLSFDLVTALKNLGFATEKLKKARATSIPFKRPDGEICKVYRVVLDGKTRYWVPPQGRISELLFIPERTAFERVIVTPSGFDAGILNVLFANTIAIGGIGETYTLLALRAHKERLDPLFKDKSIYVWVEDEESDFAEKVAELFNKEVKAFGQNLARAHKDAYRIASQRSLVTARRFILELIEKAETVK
ncbi:MAG: hypothetical protein QXO20_06810 [Candidatus Bathyarchaeia archaeon]